MVVAKRQSKNRLGFILLLGAALIAVAGIGRYLSGRERVPWREDFAVAQRESAATHKPVFAYFTAQWCPACQSLRYTTWADDSVAKALQSYVPVKVDVDAHRDIAMRYAPDFLPAFALLNSDGTIARAESGAMSPEEFLAWLKG
jgi:thiol:disulfide interchange protein